MRPSEAVRALDHALDGMRDHFDAIDNAASQREEAETKLKATQGQLQQAEKELTAAKTSIENAQREAVARFAVEEREKIAQLKSLSEQIEAAKAKLDETNVEYKSKQQAHEQIVASLNSIKKQLGA